MFLKTHRRLDTCVETQANGVAVLPEDSGVSSSTNVSTFLLVG